METFEYITALVAVVIGLAIVDLTTSLHRLLRNRKVVRWDWVSPLAAIMILTELFNLWWQWRDFTGATIGDVVPHFLLLILVYLAASISLPDDVPEGGIDLGRYFDENRSYFWIVYGSYVAVSNALSTIQDVQSGLSISELLGIYYFEYSWIAVAFGMVFDAATADKRGLPPHYSRLGAVGLRLVA